MSHDEIVDIVDENDNVLYQLSRKEAFEKNQRCRVVHSFLIDRLTKKILLLVRGKNVSFRPLHYAAVGGYVQTGETWEQAAKREVLEEVGLDVHLTFLGKRPATDQSNGKIFYDGVFAGFINPADIKIDRNDLDRVELFTLEELEKLVSEEIKIHPLLKEQLAVFRSAGASFSKE